MYSYCGECGKELWIPFCNCKGGDSDMADPTEEVRRELVDTINAQTESNNPDSERRRLEELHGEVWSTNEVTKIFEIEGFMAPFVVATRRDTGRKGTLLFQHNPRFYFKWTEHRS